MGVFGCRVIKPAPDKLYHDLCRIVGCEERAGREVCLLGMCQADCICREELLAKLTVLVINDGIRELGETFRGDESKSSEAADVKDEL